MTTNVRKKEFMKDYESYELKFHNHKTEYFLTYITVALLNVTFAYYDIFHIFFAIIAIYYLKKMGGRLGNKYYVMVIILSLVAFGQAAKFGSFQVYSYGGALLAFSFPYFIYKILGNNYWRYYVNIIYYLAIIALIFWGLQNFSDGFTDLLENISSSLMLDPGSNESIIIYNLEHHREIDIWGLMKNAGFTAEGGVYSALLILALYFNTLFSKIIFDKKNIIFIISILTTTSTAGYAALGFYLIATSIYLKRISYKIILFPASILLIYFALFQLNFMLDKVSKYYTDEMNVYNTQANPSRVGRFLSARVDIDLIIENPLHGRGIYKSSRYLTPLEEEIGYSNSYLGIIGLASKYGLVVWFLYFYFLIKILLFISETNGLNKNFGYLFLLSILAIGTGQNPFTGPSYLILVYQGLHLKN